MHKTTKREYDLNLKSKAYTGLGLRVTVAAYMIYLAWMILLGMRKGGSPIPEWAVWVICIFFAAAALYFCVYALKAFVRALKSAEVKAEHKQ